MQVSARMWTRNWAGVSDEEMERTVLSDNLSPPKRAARSSSARLAYEGGAKDAFVSGGRERGQSRVRRIRVP